MTLQDWTVVDRPSTQRPSTQGGARVFRDSRQDPPGERQFAPITPQVSLKQEWSSVHHHSFVGCACEFTQSALRHHSPPPPIVHVGF